MPDVPEVPEPDALLPLAAAPVKSPPGEEEELGLLRGKKAPGAKIN